jgi:hypothetical protein
MLEYFYKACEHVKKRTKYKVWQNSYHAEHIYSNVHTSKTRLHTQQPVKIELLLLTEDYYYSSAAELVLDNDLKADLLDSF